MNKHETYNIVCSMIVGDCSSFQSLCSYEFVLFDVIMTVVEWTKFGLKQ